MTMTKSDQSHWSGNQHAHIIGMIVGQSREMMDVLHADKVIWKATPLLTIILSAYCAMNIVNKV